jgi:hypothetical protein
VLALTVFDGPLGALMVHLPRFHRVENILEHGRREHFGGRRLKTLPSVCGDTRRVSARLQTGRDEVSESSSIISIFMYVPSHERQP